MNIINGILTNLLSDKKGGEIFHCFGLWHFIYIGLTLVVIIALGIYLKSRQKDKRKKIIDTIGTLAFIIYIADFFLMPLAYGEIDIEKLPFHICTAMCVLCYLERYSKLLTRFRLQLVTLGFISNLTYLIYPAGVMWHQVHPFSYRVVQTLIFHSVMTIYCTFVLCFDEYKFDIQKCYKELLVISGMTIWAVIGNTVYNSADRVYNWFFVIQDPFYIFSENISPYIMPPLNILLFFIIDVTIIFIFSKIKNSRKYN